MRRILAIVLLLLGLTLVGTIGFRMLYGATWIDCLYMAVITLTTVGYEEVFPLDTAGKLFVICYLVFGLGIFTYSAFTLGQWIVSAELQTLLEKRRMQKAVDRMSEHFVVCGMGRMGRVICEYLAHRERPFVVVDRDHDSLVEANRAHGWPYVHGDATDDDVLVAAGVGRAKSLATVLATDADNVYITLSARLLNPRVQIVARASEEDAIRKIERAGATRVVSPFSSGAVKMARFMLNPSLEDFLEVADTRDNDLELCEVQVLASSRYVGKTLAETDLRAKGIMIVGIRRVSGERLLPPPGTATLHAGDSLFAFGKAEAINAVLDREVE
jgi:voltage-gated potassium channel